MERTSAVLVRDLREMLYYQYKEGFDLPPRTSGAISVRIIADLEVGFRQSELEGINSFKYTPPGGEKMEMRYFTEEAVEKILCAESVSDLPLSKLSKLSNKELEVVKPLLEIILDKDSYYADPQK